MFKNQRGKIGRNEPCPCGSGKKYKNCHGDANNINTPAPFSLNHADTIKKLKKQIESKEVQRTQQQGLGRPIISTVHEGYRLVFVGNRVSWNKEEKWRTFPSFLDTYLIQVFGENWGKAELKKDLKETHPVIQWHDCICKERKKASNQVAELIETPVTGAMFAYLTLAYNLYLIAHNIHLVHGKGLHARLVERLKNKESFYSAFYETMVVASFIKAGFTIELENEEDGITDHAEFVATSRKTGIKYSVEAKHRQAEKKHFGIKQQLFKALKKDLAHKRVVFINLNVKENIKGGRIEWLHDVIGQMRNYESALIDGQSAPEAYVFVTNHPFLYNLDSFEFPPAAVAEGFKMPDFKFDSAFLSLRDALKSREKHIDMFDLMKAMKEYDQIPCTFDGEIPEYAFGEIKEPRPKIGDKYLVPDSSGNEVVAVLEDAAVLENEKKVYGVYRLEDGKQIIAGCPLSEKEFTVFKQYPDTFFGLYKRQNRKARDPLELFDFFHGVYKNTSKEKLLEFMKEHSDFEKLKGETQEELAMIYCERAVYAAMKKTSREKKSI
jgi:hypothetical protein